MNRILRQYSWMILPAITAFLAGIGFIAMPPLSDDLGYMMPFRDMILNGNGDWWHSVCESVSYRYYNDNPRLANVIMILIAVLPRAIPGIISMIALATVFYIGIKWASLQNKPITASLWTASIIVFFPWIDQLYLINFQLNYLWATALALICIFNWYNTHLKAWQSFLVGLIVAVWHEGFGIPLTITIAGLLMLYRDMRTRYNILNLTGLLIGTLYLIVSPGFLNNTWAYFENRSAILYPFAIPTVVFVLTWLFMVTKKEYRHICMDSHVAAGAALSLLGTIMMLMFPTGPRSGSLGITLACLSSVYLWANLKGFRCSRRSGMIILALINAIIFIHLIFVDYIAIKINRETRQAIEAYRAQPSEPHFVGMTLREDSPYICLQKPYYGLLAHYGNVNVFNRFYGFDGMPIMTIPKSAVNYKSSVFIPGSAMIENRDGILVGPALTDSPDIVLFNVDYGKGTSQREFYTVPFVEPSTGKRLAWYYPNYSSIDILLHPLPLNVDL
ncbi:MAG: hypothetical protein Q4C34_00895 [Bacteroidales bacterium]|nr:hypothetical protein [Bacteroidales bacterium]